jgi:hypothetical protein
MRSLSQSLNKEFGKQNIHVAHVCSVEPLAFLSLMLVDSQSSTGAS